jgi:hypothetical protein
MNRRIGLWLLIGQRGVLLGDRWNARRANLQSGAFDACRDHSSRLIVRAQDAPRHCLVYSSQRRIVRHCRCRNGAVDEGCISTAEELARPPSSRDGPRQAWGGSDGRMVT